MASTKIGKPLILGFICLLITAVILIVGLWPFNFFPPNKVERLHKRNGLRFYGQSMVLSLRPLDFGAVDPSTGSISIELLVQPHRESNNTVTSILTLYDRDHEQIMIGQWLTHLAVWVPSTDLRRPHHEIGISHALAKDVTHLITLVSEKKATDIYIDGKLNEHLPDFTLVPDESHLSGQLLLGNSADGVHSWNGFFFGLAIYNRILSGKEVEDHYYEWKKLGRPSPKDDCEDAKDAKIILNRPIALYFFDEQSGTTIQDHSGSGNNLLMPQTFQPFRRTILGMPDKGFFFTRSNLLDIAVNVLGFIPFGFFFPAWLQQAKDHKTSFIYGITLFLGFFLSLGIELTQAYIPTRDSSLLDVISNTVGTALGALCLRASAKSIF